MQSTSRLTRSSVLGKRSHQADIDSSPTKPDASQDDLADAFALATPDSSPCAKRPRTSVAVFDPNGNKENIPPLDIDDILVSAPSTPRALRRATSELVTPSRSRQISRRYASSSTMNPPGTPSSIISSLVIQTPPPTPTSTLPLYARARALLRTTCNNAGDIAGRQSESEILRSFITAFVHAEDRATGAAEPVLYLSGSPGCGKTALVNSMLTSLQADMDEHRTRLLFVNCMALNSLDAVWDRLATELGGLRKKTKARATSDLVQDLFTKSESKCLLVLDEVDHVATTGQALSKLFSLTQNCASSLHVIGIANTHTLTSASPISMAGITGVRTLHFAPYEPKQLVEILESRLRPLSESVPEQQALKKFLPPATLKLLSMKIASQTGDVRAIFEVLRNAIDISIAQTSAPKDTTSPVTPTHIQAALKAYTPASSVNSAVAVTASSKPQCNSEMVAKISNLGLQSRLVLLALLVACKRAEAGLVITGSRTSTNLRNPKRTASAPSTIRSASASVDINQLHALYTAMLTRDSSDIFTPASRSEFTDLVNVLETVGLIEKPAAVGSPITPSKRKLARTQSFGGAHGKSQDVTFTEGVRAPEILRGLGIDGEASSSSDGRLEEEVAAMWSGELARIRKEAKQQAPKRSKGDSVVGFDDAVED